MKLFAIVAFATVVALTTSAHAEMQLLVKVQGGRACSVAATGFDGNKTKIRPLSDSPNEYANCASLPASVSRGDTAPISRANSVSSQQLSRSTLFAIGDRV